MELIQEFILNPSNHSLLTLVKGFRNGVVYGAKVRFPHSLVMTFLFKSDLNQILCVRQEIVFQSISIIYPGKMIHCKSGLDI